PRALTLLPPRRAPATPFAGHGECTAGSASHRQERRRRNGTDVVRVFRRRADEGGGLRKRRSSARKRGKRNNPKATICAGVIPCCIAEMKLHIMSERDSPGRSNAVRHP